ncbi:hypothetical protein ACP4OV_021206 [Aristida adscensionis]
MNLRIVTAQSKSGFSNKIIDDPEACPPALLVSPEEESTKESEDVVNKQQALSDLSSKESEDVVNKQQALSDLSSLDLVSDIKDKTIEKEEDSGMASYTIGSKANSAVSVGQGTLYEQGLNLFDKPQCMQGFRNKEVTDLERELIARKHVSVEVAGSAAQSSHGDMPLSAFEEITDLERALVASMESYLQEADDKKGKHVFAEPAGSSGHVSSGAKSLSAFEKSVIWRGGYLSAGRVMVKNWTRRRES